jgi:hypothetical protein
MNAIRIRKKLDSTTLHLPELQGLIGKEVEMIVLEETPREPLETMETFFGLAPARPPATPEEVSALREAATTDPALSAVLELSESDAIDVEAVVALRAESGR